MEINVTEYFSYNQVVNTVENQKKVKEWIRDKVVIYERCLEGSAGFPQPWGWLYKKDFDIFYQEYGVKPSVWNPIPDDILIDTRFTKKYENNRR